MFLCVYNILNYLKKTNFFINIKFNNDNLKKTSKKKFLWKTKNN